MNPTRAELYRQAMRAALLGLVVNLLLGVVKLIGGLASGSLALLSDAVNSLGDMFTSLVVLGALHFAQRPPDDEHPYGHTRAEAIAASNVALAIMFSALVVGWEALGRLADADAPPPPGWALAIAAANVVVKEALYRYKVRVGRRTGSQAVIAVAWDHRSDAFCSLAVLIGLAVVRWGGPAWAWADQAAALIVVTAILWNAAQLFRRGASELMDVQAGGDLVDGVRGAAAETPGVCAVEKLWIRKSGLEYFVDIHIEVDAGLTVAAGHRIGHLVKDRLLERFPAVRDVLVHLEPHPHEHASG